MATGINYLLAAVTNGGVFKSINNGNSWSLSNSGITNLYPKTFLQSSNSICVGTINDAFISNDNASTWTSMNTPTLNVRSMTIDASNVFLGTWNNGVWIRSNTLVFSGMSELGANQSQVSLFPNPTTGIVNLIISEKLFGSELQVYNLLGELINNSKLQTLNYQLNLNEQANGIYFIRIGSQTKKIIKE